MLFATAEEVRQRLQDRLSALEKTWDDFTHDCELELAESKLGEWVSETEALLSDYGKPNALHGLSQLAAKITDREGQFFERVKKYRMFLSMLIGELGEDLEPKKTQSSKN